jgi:hypothetical protein
MSARGMWTKVAFVVVAVGTLAACGGGGDAGPTPVASPTVSQARITVTATAPTITLSPLPDFTFRLTIPVTIAESAGLGANINFIRLSLIRGGVELERQEISSALLISQSGSNRLAASATRTFQLLYDVNAGTATSGILTCNFTDDRGNNQSASFTITF